MPLCAAKARWRRNWWQYAAAERDLVELDAVRTRLRRGGIEVVRAEPGDLAPRLADAYLMLKAAGRL